MDVAIKATWGQIALNGVVAIMFVAIYIYSSDTAFLAMLALLAIQTLALYFVVGALKVPKKWVIILYSIWCLYGLLSAIAGGLNLPNLLALVSGVLAAVALYDMTMWYLETRKVEKT